MKCWTDGSCLGNPGPGGWGVVWEDGREFRGGEAYTTNNRMELTAIIEAVKSSTSFDMTIYTDSKWCINVLTGAWEGRSNTDLIDQYLSIAKTRAVHFEWVKGHNGNSQNERADKLATLSAQEEKRLANRG